MRSGDLQRVQELIQSGEDVNPRLSVGTGSLLMVSISHSYKDIALALLEAGADVHAKGARGRTALQLACELGLEDVVQGLIDRGSQVEGDTPLRFASDKTTMLLLRAGASCEGLPIERRVPLFRHACAVGDLQNVRTLLKNGCTISTLSKVEQAALLHYACREGDVTVVEALIDAGCDVNYSGYEGDTPLMKAAREGHEEVVKKLILAGANVAMHNDVGFTALYFAAIHNHIQCAILLAEAGASVRIKENCSDTLLRYFRADFKEAIKEALSFTT